MKSRIVAGVLLAVALAHPLRVAAQPPQPPAPSLVLNLPNASLTEVIDILARQLRINYILDPRVKGTVTINTYGELRQVDVRALLETILRINQAAMVQVGEIYRIVPSSDVARLPISPQAAGTLPDDERIMLNLIFLKYATVAELSKILQEFLGEGAKMVSYDPANLLLILDNARNMKRTMELIALFDSDAFAGQRVRLFEVKHGKPSDVVKELETVFKAVSLSDKLTAAKFMPVDRINTIIAVAPNPTVFPEIEKWLEKLDIPVKAPVGSIDNYVFRVKYGRAETLAMAIMQLYGGFSGYGYGGGYGGQGGFPGGGFPGGGYGQGGMMGGFPGSGFGGNQGLGQGGFGNPNMPMGTQALGGQGPMGGAAGALGVIPGQDMTGQFFGAGGMGGPRTPRVVPNPLDNSLLIQATPQEHEQIVKLLEKLDVPPRQVLIEARIYEVSLTGAFASGVQAFVNKVGATRTATSGSSLVRNLTGSVGGAGLTLSSAALIANSRELLATVTAQEETRRAKVISSPSIIATDSIAATITVGQEVPTLTSQAVTGVQQGGSSLFANTVQNRQSGVTLAITARVLPSGIVTMIINQDVSSPIPPTANASIQSPSFSRRSVQTQVTVQDSDTIAIAGIIQESDTVSTAGIPVLQRIPVVGGLFGNRSTSKERTELIVFMTPRVIYDTNEVTEASDELRLKLKRLSKMIRE